MKTGSDAFSKPLAVSSKDFYVLRDRQRGSPVPTLVAVVHDQGITHQANSHFTNKLFFCILLHQNYCMLYIHETLPSKSILWTIT